MQFGPSRCYLKIFLDNEDQWALNLEDQAYIECDPEQVFWNFPKLGELTIENLYGKSNDRATLNLF
jgi:hypothetical protein